MVYLYIQCIDYPTNKKYATQSRANFDQKVYFFLNILD